VSTLELPASPSGPAAGPPPQGDRLRVITAGRVGSMEARLGTSGFDVVAVAGTEEDLIVAVSAGEPDAVVVEADLCQSLERVRDLAPDAVVIAVGQRTPAGAHGRIQPGVSGTVMAGLLHALVAEGVGAAVAFGFLPVLRPPAAARVPQHITGSLLWAKAELLRAVESALSGQQALVAAAGAVAVTVSASVLLVAGQPRTHDRPRPLPIPTQAVERALRPPVAVVSSGDANTTSPSLWEGARGGRPTRTHAARGGARRGRMRRASSDPRRQHHPRSDHPSPPDHPTRPDHPTAPAPAHGSRPPARASGLDHRPPKRAEHGTSQRVEQQRASRASPGGPPRPRGSEVQVRRRYP
jgi:hypothetical protein